MHAIYSVFPRVQPASINHGSEVSPSDNFDKAMEISHDLASRAWHRIDGCYERAEEKFASLNADSSSVVAMAKAICRTYNAPETLDCVLAALYLKHRSRYLTSLQDYFARDGAFSPYRAAEESELDSVSAYGYPTCSGQIVDIVDFGSINPAKISIYRPHSIGHIWRHIKLDQELPLEIVSYEAALLELDICLEQMLVRNEENLTPTAALQDLSRCLLDFELNREEVMPAIALLVHAILLGSK